MLNKVFLIGNLGQTPRVRYSKDGLSIVNFSLATNEFIKRNTNFEKVTQWHNIVAFGVISQFCMEKLKKGDKVFVEGKIRYRTYDKDGVTVKFTEIVAKNIKLLSKSDEQTEEEDIAVRDTQMEGKEEASVAEEGIDSDSGTPF